MSLTTAQQQALKSYIDSVPAWAALPNDSSNALIIAEALNLIATPAFIVWKTRVTTEEVGNAVNYVAVEAMTDANRGRITTFYAMNAVDFDPSRSDIRSYWSNTFSGALGGQGQTTRDALDALWRRGATVVEKVLATGTGSAASPATMGYEGSVAYWDVQAARAV